MSRPTIVTQVRGTPPLWLSLGKCSPDACLGRLVATFLKGVGGG